MSFDTVAFLRRLVAIDSTSTRANGPVLDVLEETLRPLGFVTRRMRWLDDNGVEKQNLIARRGPERAGGLALVGHSDCVPFDAAWSGALAGEVRDDKLYGRGSADTKAYLAAAVAAAAATTESSEPLYILSTADEEVGCIGAKRLLEEGTVRPEYAIIGEPTRLTPVCAHKGYCVAQVEITGVEAHSAYPDLGASANFAAGRFLGELERVQEELAGDRDSLFAPPHTTINVGLLHGGKARNVVPGLATMTIEWRPIPGQDVRHAFRLFEAAAARVTGGKIWVDVKATRLDKGVSVAPDVEVIRFLEQESGNAVQTIPFGTELPELTALGAQACVFGPGDIRVAHKTDEFVPLADLRAAERILINAVQRFCRS